MLSSEINNKRGEEEDFFCLVCFALSFFDCDARSHHREMRPIFLIIDGGYKLVVCAKKQIQNLNLSMFYI